MKNKMKLSVIIPIYQGEAFIEKSVASLQDQGYENIEIILIDDGSTDRSGELCDALQEKDHRIQVIHQKNQGPSAARNAGIASATGDYIAFVDADDALSKNAFYEMMQALNGNDYDMLIFGSVFEYYNKGVFIKSEVQCVKEQMALNHEGLANSFVALNDAGCLTAIWNKVVKRCIIDDHHIRFNESMRIYEDFEFFLQVARHIDKVCVLPNPLYHYAIEAYKSLIIKRTLVENSYFKNIDTLKQALEKYLAINPVSPSDKKALNEIIFRGYIYEIELAFLLNKSFRDKMKVINEFFIRNSIQDCIQNSSPTKFRMSMIHRGFIKKNKPLIYFLFLIKTYETKLIYTH